MRRRDFLAGAAGLVAAGAMRPTPAAAADEVIEITPALISQAQKEGRLLLRHTAQLDEVNGMTSAFEARFGVKVQLDRKVGVVATQTFATEERAGQHLMDVNFGADPAGLQELAEEGLYLRFTLPDLASKLDPGAYIPGLGYCPRWSDIVLSYNPGLIPHDQAKAMFKTWNGLLDPSLVGKIGINEPAGGGVAFALFLMFYRLPQYGAAFLDKLAAQKPRLYPGSAPAREDLSAGAISVFIPNWEAVSMVQFMKGDKTAWLCPEIIPSFANSHMSISAKAPHPAAARLFVAWVFSPEGAKAVAANQNRPTLKNIPDERSAIAKLRETSWWAPIPEGGHWVPDEKDWEDNYAELMPDMRRRLGWTR